MLQWGMNQERGMTTLIMTVSNKTTNDNDSNGDKVITWLEKFYPELLYHVEVLDSVESNSHARRYDCHLVGACYHKDDRVRSGFHELGSRL